MGTETQLPAPQNRPCEKAHQHLKKLVNHLPEGRDHNPFLCALFHELNALPEDTNVTSALVSAANICVLRLVPGKVFGHAHIIPFNNRKTGRKEAQLIVGYQGFLELAFRNEFLTDCNAEVVLDGEEFSHGHHKKPGIGCGPWFEHAIPLGRNIGPDTIQAAYCTYNTKNGGSGFWLCERTEIESVRKRNDIWRYHYAAMAMKTAVRRAAKFWRKSAELSVAISLDEQVDADEAQTCHSKLLSENDGMPYTDVLLAARNNLDLHLDDRIGCQDMGQRDAVLTWALKKPTTYMEVRNDKGLISDCIARFSEFSQENGNKISKILEEIGEHGRDTAE